MPHRLIIAARVFFVFVLLGGRTHSQSLPFYLNIEEAPVDNLPAIHSYAKAQSGNYWLIATGRTDGMHSFFPNSAFPIYEQNNFLFVIDTVSWQVWSTSLKNVEYHIQRSLSSVNTQFVQRENELYITGGYGFDSISAEKITFPTLTALNVDGLINEIVSGGTNLSPYIRQITDTVFAVTGGRLEYFNDKFYLIGGQYFNGFYTKLNSEFFVQRYTNSISSFSLLDDGESLLVSDYQQIIDTANFHRRDLNSSPILFTDGQEGIGIYGGVFQYTHNLPFQNPVIFSSTGASVIYNTEQKMSQYTCGLVPLFDSLSGNMYSVFMGGISLYDVIDSTSELKLDTLIPYINDISVLINYGDGSWEEKIMAEKMPALGGANAEFFLNKNTAHYSNGVIKLHEIKNKTLLGYLYGGINSTAGNEGITSGSNKVYKVFLEPDLGTSVASPFFQDPFQVSPNPASSNINIISRNSANRIDAVTILNFLGERIFSVSNTNENSTDFIRVNTSILEEGLYLMLIYSDKARAVKQFAVIR